MRDFTGQRVAITGAGSGIGRALAQALSSQDCQVFLSDCNAESLEETRCSLTKPERCKITVLDVADAGAVQAWADGVARDSEHLDVMINNAGVALIAEAAETTLEQFHWLMNINFWGVIHGCQSFLPLLERSPAGRLVNVSSVFGMIGVPGQAAYNASKFGIRGYSEALRQELDASGSHVKLCCVQPGGVGTNIARNARNADPQATPEEQQEVFARHVRTRADDAAQQILRAAARGKPRLLIGTDARLLDLLLRFAPVAYPQVLKRLFPHGASLS